tara:strand:- start:3412 stop:4185 length:774 start_codon:yes stop_codon:yes gene_type:complete
MKVVILAGGLGTRISEETHLKPKPMLEIGGKPILWHILKIYSSFGFNEFIICCGYKGYVIKEYFANYFLHSNNVTFHMDNKNRMEIHSRKAESWKVTLVDTGEKTLTASRLLKVKSFLNPNQHFCFTYGDGLANINISQLVSFHKEKKKKVTLTAVQPPGRYGSLDLDENEVKQFVEKPKGDNGWINGGFFVVDPSILNLIIGDQCSWEEEVLPKLAYQGELNAFKHKGFWLPMDTLRDKNRLNYLWEEKKAAWKVW